MSQVILQFTPVFYFDLMINETGCGDDVMLVNWFLRHFAMAFNTLMSMTFLVKAPCYNVSIAFIFYFDVRVCADEFREELLLKKKNSGLTFACR